jgi:hypothetical protein
MPMILRRMQHELARLNDIEVGYDVYDFLTTDRNFVAGLLRSNEHRDLEEQLLLADTPQGARLSLYLDAELLARLESADSRGAICEHALPDFCTALEGVSHFLYAAWRLSHGASMSLLELETQAEVDKYAVAMFRLAAGRAGAFPRDVHRRLFEAVHFDSRLMPSQRSRYETASRCAATFCRSLERRFLKRAAPRIEAMLRELRRFYRLGSGAKLQHGFTS